MESIAHASHLWWIHAEKVNPPEIWVWEYNATLAGGDLQMTYRWEKIFGGPEIFFELRETLSLLGKSYGC